jgi:tryptophanyl-tRNA synthetase
MLASHLNNMLMPIREKRQYYESNKDTVRDMIAEGSRKASRIGDETVAMIREAMSLNL